MIAPVNIGRFARADFVCEPVFIFPHSHLTDVVLVQIWRIRGLKIGRHIWSLKNQISMGPNVEATAPIRGI